MTKGLRKNLKILLIIFFCVLSLSNIKVVYASDNSDNGIKSIDEFNDLSGDAQYLGDSHRDNYYLDIEETGLLDTGYVVLNNIANVLFSMIKFLAYLVVAVFYFSMDFDVGKLFASQLDTIQAALNTSIFKPLFALAFAATSFPIVKNLAKRNTVGIINEFLKVIGIVMLSYLVVAQSGTALSFCTNITKSISVGALSGINKDMGTKSTKSFSADASGILWVNLVHQPWLSLEFSNSKTSDKTVKSFLSTAPSTKKREKLVDKYMDSHKKSTNFNKSKGVSRIGFLLVYFFPFVIKSAIYLAIALIQLVFQLLAVFYLILAPVILILAMIPGYEMTISIWFRKIIESQVSILIVTFMMGLLIKLDSLLYALSDHYGWFIILMFQTAIGVGLFLGRNKILGAFSNMQKGMSRPGYARSKMMKFGNVYEGMEHIANKHSNSRKRLSNNRNSARIPEKIDTEEVERPQSAEVEYGRDLPEKIRTDIDFSQYEADKVRIQRRRASRMDAESINQEGKPKEKSNTKINTEVKGEESSTTEIERPKVSYLENGSDGSTKAPTQKTESSNSNLEGNKSRKPIKAPKTEIERPNSVLQENEPRTTPKAPRTEIKRPNSNVEENESRTSTKAPRSETERSNSNLEEKESRILTKAPSTEIERPDSSLQENESRTTSKAPSSEIERPNSNLQENESRTSPKAPRSEIERPDSNLQEKEPRITPKAPRTKIERPDSSLQENELRTSPKAPRSEIKRPNSNLERTEPGNNIKAPRAEIERPNSNLQEDESRTTTKAPRSDIERQNSNMEGNESRTSTKAPRTEIERPNSNLQGNESRTTAKAPREKIEKLNSNLDEADPGSNIKAPITKIGRSNSNLEVTEPGNNIRAAETNIERPKSNIKKKGLSSNEDGSKKDVEHTKNNKERKRQNRIKTEIEV